MEQIGKNKKSKLYSAVITGLVIAMAVAAIIFTVGRKRDKYYIVTKGVEAPNFSLPNLKGVNVTLADYRGKVLLITLWATWCPSCIEEMPSMEILYQDLKKRGAPFDLLAINIDLVSPEQLKPIAQRLNISFPFLYDKSTQIAYTYKMMGVPESYIIDKKGIIREKIRGGYDWSRPAIRDLIDELLKEEG